MMDRCSDIINFTRVSIIRRAWYETFVPVYHGNHHLFIFTFVGYMHGMIQVMYPIYIATPIIKTNIRRIERCTLRQQ